MLPNSSVPALLGRKALRDQRTLLDCFNNRLYRIGPGGYSLQLSPGSAQYHLEESHAGHLMLPCDLYGELTAARVTGPAKTMALATSTAAASTAPTSSASPTPTAASPPSKKRPTPTIPPRQQLQELEALLADASSSGAAGGSDSGQPGRFGPSGSLHL